MAAALPPIEAIRAIHDPHAPWTTAERCLLTCLVLRADYESGWTPEPKPRGAKGFDPVSHARLAAMMGASEKGARLVLASLERASIELDQGLVVSPVVVERGGYWPGTKARKEHRYQITTAALRAFVGVPRDPAWDEHRPKTKRPPRKRVGPVPCTEGGAVRGAGGVRYGVPGSDLRGRLGSITAPPSQPEGDLAGAGDAGEQRDADHHRDGFGPPRQRGAGVRGLAPDADAHQALDAVASAEGLELHDDPGAPRAATPWRDSGALAAPVSSQARDPKGAELRTLPVAAEATPDPDESWPWAPPHGPDARAGSAARVVANGDALLAGDPEDIEGSEGEAQPAPSAGGPMASPVDGDYAARHRDPPDAAEPPARTGAVHLRLGSTLTGQDRARDLGAALRDPDASVIALANENAAVLARLTYMAEDAAEEKAAEKTERARRKLAEVASKVLTANGGEKAVSAVVALVRERPALADLASIERAAYGLQDLFIHPDLDLPGVAAEVAAAPSPRLLARIAAKLDGRTVRKRGPAGEGCVGSIIRGAVREVMGLPRLPPGGQARKAEKPKPKKAKKGRGDGAGVAA